MLYYRGSTRAATTRTIRERFGIDVPLRTLSSWIAEYRDITAFARMRDEARAGFLPHRIVRSVRLHHRQVYRYCVHRSEAHTSELQSLMRNSFAVFCFKKNKIT